MRKEENAMEKSRTKIKKKRAEGSTTKWGKVWHCWLQLGKGKHAVMNGSDL